ncbi:Rv3235 family protein [Actinomadura opuntiae]|uniref:Rv3235 family protein n=1 Tax=Actinomadura sp. OS1-43 TaxID=604315 RepID=UPI00255A8FC9|nr:Rv3235 family protein [Actinomadura sp. OS1-43]MDL4814628.1 Rv3235 family protein [Actinomadura sp. OS1-43]
MGRRPAKRPAVRIVRYRAVPSQRTDGALALTPVQAAALRAPSRQAAEPSPAKRRTAAPPGRRLRVVRPGDGVDAEVRAVADATLRIVVEVLAGTRPPHQLALVAVPAVCRGLAPHRRTVPGGRRIVPPQVLSSRVQRPSPRIAEASAVVLVAGRAHAVALRLEHTRGRWRCTAVETTAP